MANVLLSIFLATNKNTPSCNNFSGQSSYLKLESDQSEVLWWNTEFSAIGANETELDRLWDTSIPWESGIIALRNEEAESLKLPKSQPFPWDGENKSLYIINAHHMLHCVRNLYISIHEYRHGKHQSVEYSHILHCLDSLRVETMCSADDTPRYVPQNSVHGFRPGDGQMRKCRDWSKVEEFVQSHDACYKYVDPGNKELSNLERFKYCPKDSQYLTKIRKYFGYDASWIPDPDEVPGVLSW